MWAGGVATRDRVVDRTVFWNKTSHHIVKAFDGQAILVTDSTRGIGRAVAMHLASEGATVGIHGRSAMTVRATCDVVSDADGTAIPVVGDFRDPGLLSICGGVVIKQKLSILGDLLDRSTLIPHEQLRIP